MVMVRAVYECLQCYCGCQEMLKKRAIFALELGVPIVMHEYLTGGFTANPRKENCYFNFICFTE